LQRNWEDANAPKLAIVANIRVVINVLWELNVNGVKETANAPVLTLIASTVQDSTKLLAAHVVQTETAFLVTKLSNVNGATIWEFVEPKDL
jgi:hypothetical protein